MLTTKNNTHTHTLKLIPKLADGQSALKHDQVAVSLKTAVEAGEAILGPEPTLTSCFISFSPMSLSASAAVTGSTHKFDYVFFSIYSILRQCSRKKKITKCWHLSFHGTVEGSFTVNRCSTSKSQQEVVTSKALLIYNWQIERKGCH